MKKILALYDKAAERYGDPFVSVNLAVAERDFAQACKEPKSPMSMFPNDISLKYLGEIDENTGKITSLTEPVLIAEAKTYVKINEPLQETKVIHNQAISDKYEEFKNGTIDKKIDIYANNLKKGE